MPSQGNSIKTTPTHLRRLSKDHMRDAQILLSNKRLEGAKYICGFSVELILKYRICKLLHIDEYPPTHTSEYHLERAYKTHNLEVLLLLSDKKKKINKDLKLLAAWNDVKDWNSEIRYQFSELNEAEVKRIIDSSHLLLKEFGIGNL